VKFKVDIRAVFYTLVLNPVLLIEVGEILMLLLAPYPVFSEVYTTSAQTNAQLL